MRGSKTLSYGQKRAYSDDRSILSLSLLLKYAFLAGQFIQTNVMKQISAQ